MCEKEGKIYTAVCVSAAEEEKVDTFRLLKSISQRSCHCRPIGSLSSQSLAQTVFPKEIQRLKIKREQPDWKHRKLAQDVRGTKRGGLCGQRLELLGPPSTLHRDIRDVRCNSISICQPSKNALSGHFNNLI